MIQRQAYRLFGKFSDKIQNQYLERKLKQSRLFIPFSMYLSIFFFGIFLIIIGGLLLEIIFLISYLFEMIEKQTFSALSYTVAAFVFGMTAFTFAACLFIPSLYAYDKKIKIEKQLPFAVNYMSAMAIAGVRSESIFKAMATRNLISVYGELSKEFLIFNGQVEFFGKNAPSALSQLSQETSSPLFSDFLEGAKNVSISGSSFQNFIVSKKHEYQSLAARRKEKYFQTLELLSEIYIISFLAAPLFMVILLFTTMPFSGSKTEQMRFLAYQIVPFLGLVFLLILEIVNEKEDI